MRVKHLPRPQDQQRREARRDDQQGTQAVSDRIAAGGQAAAGPIDHRVQRRDGHPVDHHERQEIEQEGSHSSLRLLAMIARSGYSLGLIHRGSSFLSGRNEEVYREQTAANISCFFKTDGTNAGQTIAQKPARRSYLPLPA